VKNNVITERGGKVVYLSGTYEGKRHDKKIADAEEHCLFQKSLEAKLLNQTKLEL